MSSYNTGQFVRNKNTDRFGEVLKVHGMGNYTVRYPVYKDEDRVYDIFIESYTTLEPIRWGVSEEELYGRYLPGGKEWHVPSDTYVHKQAA